MVLLLFCLLWWYSYLFRFHSTWFLIVQAHFCADTWQQVCAGRPSKSLTKTAVALWHSMNWSKCWTAPWWKAMTCRKNTSPNTKVCDQANDVFDFFKDVWTVWNCDIKNPPPFWQLFGLRVWMMHKWYSKFPRILPVNPMLNSRPINLPLSWPRCPCWTVDILWWPDSDYD